jgi:hypothetical protein
MLDSFFLDNNDPVVRYFPLGAVLGVSFDWCLRCAGPRRRRRLQLLPPLMADDHLTVMEAKAARLALQRVGFVRSEGDSVKAKDLVAHLQRHLTPRLLQIEVTESSLAYKISQHM